MKDQYQVVQETGGLVVVAGGYQDHAAALKAAKWAGENCGGRWSVRYAGGALGAHWPLDKDLALRDAKRP